MENIWLVLSVCVCVRSWFSSQGSVASLTSSELSSSSSSSMDLGSSEGPVERWSIFGPRPPVHKSITDPGTDHGTAGSSPSTGVYLKTSRVAKNNKDHGASP